MNVEKICVQKNVGEGEDVLIKTWTRTAQTVVNAGRKLMAKLQKCAKREW